MYSAFGACRCSSGFYLARSTPTALWFGVFPRAAATLESGGAPAPGGPATVAVAGAGAGAKPEAPKLKLRPKAETKDFAGWQSVLHSFIAVYLDSSLADSSVDYISKCVFAIYEAFF